MSAQDVCAQAWSKRLFSVKSAGALLSPLIRNLGIEDAVKMGRIKSEWSDVFEKPISLHMCPAGLKAGELLINVDSPVWLQQLSFYKEDITKKLYIFGVTSVRFKVGRVVSQEKHDRPVSKKKQITPEEYSYINGITSSISDQDLRDNIRKAIEKSVAFKKSKI